MSLEPEVDFDWASVEDRAGVLMEWMLAEKMPLTRPQAEGVVRFIDRTGAMGGGDQAALAMRLLGWIGAGHHERDRPNGDGTTSKVSGIGEQRIGIRAAVAIRELLPQSRVGCMTVRQMGPIFGVKKSAVSQLVQSFRAYFRR